jgi:hypothetical protein
MLRRTVGSSSAEDPATKTLLLVFTRSSDEPLLTCWFIRCYCVILAHLCLIQMWSSDRPMVSSNGPSVHQTLLSPRLLFSNSSDATRILTLGSSDATRIWSDGVKLIPVVAQSTDYTNAMHDGTVGSSDDVFSFPFFARLKNMVIPIDHTVGSSDDVFSFPFFTRLNNTVSPIDHVVMNHLNHIRTNGIWGHVRYISFILRTLYSSISINC